MLQEAIYTNYGIQLDRREVSMRYEIFRSGDTVYTVIPISEIDEEELMERLKLSQFMISQGDAYVSSFVMSKHGTYVSLNGDKKFLLLANQRLEESRPYKMGKKLAKFHARGRMFAEPVKKTNRIGKWKELWEKRMDQMEAVWREKMHSHPSNDFERLFVDSFPYYMALGENAIQYLVDTEIDQDPQGFDAATICHERFTNDLWVGNYCVKNPFDWVIDHAGRDLAEWIRQHYLQHIHTHQPGIGQFADEYRSLSEPSSFGWRLTYARLLFPVHYFETIEEYYVNGSETRKKILEEQLEKYTNQSSYYEEFLRRFFESVRVPAKKLQISKVDWL
jgi:spore coat protein YutH